MFFRKEEMRKVDAEGLGVVLKVLFSEGALGRKRFRCKGFRV